MEDTLGLYSLAQFCPDHARMEGVNIGIVLLVPAQGFLQARMTHKVHRVKTVFGPQAMDAAWLRAIMESLEGRLKTSHDDLVNPAAFRQFVATKANNLVLTEPKPVRVGEAAKSLDELYERLVEKPEAPKRESTVHRLLDEAFKKPLFQGRIRFDERIVIPVMDQEITVPYAYQNGHLNLIRPVTIRSESLDGVCKYAVDGDLIQKNTSKRFIVVSDVDQDKVPTPTSVRAAATRLFDAYNIRMVWQEQCESFIREVEKEAHEVT